MCAVVGILNFDLEPASPILVRNMTDAVAHRGPDGEGSFVEGPVGLGHRRLAIIDLTAAAHQPMLSRNTRYVLSYNGEVYNFEALRLELEALGHQFRSRSDAEVVLEAWSAWGVECVKRFNGMFALAIWDRECKELFLVRDRYGIKPLYYIKTANSVLFGSEIKALLTHPAVSVEMDPVALIEYLTFQNLFTDRTLFKDVRLLAAGSYLKLSVTKPDLTPSSYWDFAFREPQHPDSDPEYIEEMGRLFQQAVQRQLVSDVSVSAYLSGGMDSGSITAVAASQLRNMKTFTVGFDLSSASGVEMGYDERRKAEHMSYLYKTEHYEMVLKAGDMERVMPALIWHLEDPRAGQSYPNFYAAKLASKFGKVVLAGTGGDELFGGYPWRYYRAVVNTSFDDYIDKYYLFWQRLMPNSTLQKVFAPIWNDVKHVWTRDIFRDVFQTHAQELTRPEDYINHSLYFEAKTFLHGLLLVEDKLSMAHSLETRVPFLDNDLVEFAHGVPVHLKLAKLDEMIRINENEPGPKMLRYLKQGQDGKILFRRAMERYLPKEVTEREKQGFSAPDATWFRGESIDYVRKRLTNPNARIYNYLDRAAIGGLLQEHFEGKANRRLLIWSLLNLEQWCETFLEGHRPSGSDG